MSTGKVFSIAFFVSLVTAAGVHLAMRSWEVGGSPFQRMVPVPPIAGIDSGQARQVLQAQGLVMVVTRTAPHREIPNGYVISQSPVQGSQVRSGTAVAIVLSRGAAKTKVPSLVGLTMTEAIAMLDKSGLKAGKVERRPDPTVPLERVAASKPAPGDEVSGGDSIDLWLSAGPALVEVPDVTGKSLKNAKKALTAAGLSAGKTRLGYNDDRPPGIVTKQAPEAGEKVAPKTAVDLVVNAD